jgi:dTDP-4-amino-4,6-dideoxy-D-galactose acyltransferase
MENKYVRLQWDSDFFGFEVARITRFDIDAPCLSLILRELKTNNYRMVYWYVPSGHQMATRVAQMHGGLLADEKVTYVKELTCTTLASRSSSYSTIPYLYEEPEPALINLALESGEYSRFRLDPLFPAELFEKLYSCWITRAVRKENAWEVLVVKDKVNILGLISLGSKDERGDIGLLAVSSQARRKGIGGTLVADAERCFVERGYAVAQVVTQRANTAACKLYETCGYRVEKIDNIFHFWL